MFYHNKYLEVKPLKELIEESISGGWITECFYFMKHFIKNKQESTITEQLLKDMISLESWFNDLNRRFNQSTISLEDFTISRNKIVSGILDLRILISRHFPEPTNLGELLNESNSDKHIVTLVTNHDFDSISDKEKHELIEKFLKIFSSCPDYFIYKNIKKGSLRIAFDSNLKHFIDLKFLYKIGFLKNFQVESILINEPAWERLVDKYIAKTMYEMSTGNRYVLQNLAFDHMDLSGLDFGYIEFSNCNFNNVSFRSTNCNDVVFRETLLNNANFSESNLCDIQFIGVELLSGIFNQATIQSVEFLNSKLKYAVFHSSNIKESLFIRSELKQADFQKAHIEDVLYNGKTKNFEDSDIMELDSVNFSGSFLTEVKFRDLSGFNLLEKDWNANRLSFRQMVISGNFSGKNLDEYHFTNCQVSNCDFSNASLKKSKLTNCNVTNTSFKRTDLSKSKLDKSNFKKSDFDEANLDSSSLLKIDMDDYSRLRKAKLNSTMFSKSISAKLVESGVDISNVIFVDDDDEKGGGSNPSGTGPKSPSPSPVPVNPIVPELV